VQLRLDAAAAYTATVLAAPLATAGRRLQMIDQQQEQQSEQRDDMLPVCHGGCEGHVCHAGHNASPCRYFLQMENTCEF
jgi:hypothetical protein